MTQYSTGAYIIWRERLCADASAMRRFYASVLNWAFADEHAENFAWGEGKGVYGLISTNDGIQGGITEVQAGYPTGWFSYVRTNDVDTIVGRVEQASGRVVRAPFDVPGIGRNAIVALPGGASFGLTQPSYEETSAPSAFRNDLLLSADGAPTLKFLKILGLKGLVDNGAIEIVHMKMPQAGQDRWIPRVATPDVAASEREALRLGATRAPISGLGDRYTILSDPDGAWFALGGD